MRKYVGRLLAIVIIASASVAAADTKTEKPLTNADVLELSGVKLGDDLVVAKINQAISEELDVSTEALIALKKAGVGAPVIEAMIKRVAGRTASTASASSPPSTAATPTNGQAKPPSSPKPAPAGSDGVRACQQNFSMEGSFLKGRTYKTFVPLGKIDRNAAFDRAAQFIATDGWRIATSTRDIGIITATQDVNWSDGKTAPLSTVLKESNDGVTIQVTFSTPAGTTAPKDAIVKAFCGITDAAGGT